MASITIQVLPAIAHSVNASGFRAADDAVRRKSSLNYTTHSELWFTSRNFIV